MTPFLSNSLSGVNTQGIIKWVTILVFIWTALPFANAQTTVQGISFSPSLMGIKNGSPNFCFSSFPPPRITNCVIDASNTIGLKLNYWRRIEGEHQPIFVEGGMGVRYFSNELGSTEFTREADTLSVILSQQEAEENFQSLYLHFSMALGYRFQVSQVPVRIYAGLFTDLPVWGKRKYNSFETFFYEYFVYDDPSCQCMRLFKIPLGQPINQPGHSFEEVGINDGFIGHLTGGLLGIDVDLPLKSSYRFSIGYRYERVLSQPDFRSHELTGFHNLNLSIGFAKSRAISSGRSGRQHKGFVLGTQANIWLYDDGYTTNMLGFDLAFGYNTKKEIRPEMRLSIFNQLSGKEAGGLAASGGIAFTVANGYLVPRTGLTYALWWEWASELTKKSTSIYGGVGFQYPNTGRLRMEISILARQWFGNDSHDTFRPLTLGYGVYYIFGRK